MRGTWPRRPAHGRLGGWWRRASTSTNTTWTITASRSTSAPTTGRNFRLVSAQVESPGREGWVEVVPHRPDTMLEGTESSGHYVLLDRAEALPRLRVTEFVSGATHLVSSPNPHIRSTPGQREFETNIFRFGYESLVTPSSVFDYDMATRERDPAEAAAGAGRIRSRALLRASG